jgi:GNAT superfamily N-acetyltransferase
VTFRRPAPLTSAHDCAAFRSGRDALDVWLKRRALRNQASGASRTFVACDEERVVAYYALASGAVAIADATGRLRQNMPDPIPVVVLARLAVDRAYQGRGLGRALLRDAGLRIVQAAEVIGIRGVIVHALDGEAEVFYRHLGFEPSPLDPMTLMIKLSDLSVSRSP